MIIDIFTDYACPYCYIGKRHLDNAIRHMELEQVTIRHRVFQLEPGKVSHPERTFVQGLNLQTEAQEAKLRKTFDHINHLAHEVNLPYQLNGVLDVSTLTAHRITLWAQEQGKGNILSEKLFYAMFVENKDISDPSFLLHCVKEIGLSVEVGKEVIESNLFMNQVFTDDEEAHRREIDLIPHFIVNDNHEINGIVNEKQLSATLRLALAE